MAAWESQIPAPKPKSDVSRRQETPTHAAKLPHDYPTRYLPVMGTEKPKVIMGPMRWPDGSPVSPEAEAAVKAKVGAAIDRTVIAGLPPRASAALAALARQDPEKFQAVWRVVRAARLGLMPAEEAERELAELAGRDDDR
jgi:hypothetical protein